MNEIKKIFLTSLVKGASLMLGMVIILGITYALTFPSSPPTGQTSGGVFADILNKIVSNGDYKTSTGTVKYALNSDKVDGLHANELLASTSGGATDFFVTYGYTSCPTGWTKVYDGILEAIATNNAQSYMNLQGNIGAQAAISTVCAGSSRDGIPNLEYANAAYVYLPLTNWSNYTKTMSCAVCVR